MDAARQSPSETDGGAIASLVLGILGITVIPVIFSVLALVYGYRARARFRAGSTLKGNGVATAGLALGWIGVALTAVWVVALVSVLRS